MKYFDDLKMVEKLFALTLSTSSESLKEKNLIKELYAKVGEEQFWKFA